MTELIAPSQKSIERAAQVWCEPSTSHIEMDVVLASEFAKVLDEYEKQPLEPQLGCATTRDLLEEIKVRIEIDGNLDYRTIDSD